jgi:hypothetical protein
VRTDDQVSPAFSPRSPDRSRRHRATWAS